MVAGLQAGTGRQIGCAAAAILGEVAEQRVHGLEARGVNHLAALAAHRHQSGAAQPVEMKCQGVRCEPKRNGDLAGRQALRSGLHEQAINVQPTLLGEGRERGNGICRFHISTNIEMRAWVKDISTSLEMCREARVWAQAGCR